MNMLLSRDGLFAIGFGFAAVLIPLLVFMAITFKPERHHTEQQLLAFSPQNLAVKTRNWQEGGVVCLIATGQQSATDQATGQKASGAANPATYQHEPTLSFILYGGARDMAIINGHLLNTGQSAQGIRLLRIEQSRVQIEDRKGKRWLTMH